MSFVDEFADFVGSVPYRAARLPWGEARVWDLGRGDPVVLLHGVSSSRRIFFRLAPLLAERFRVLVPPLRGEDIACRRLTYEDHEADLEALLDGLGNVTLFGVSFGGAIALSYAARRDPRVRRVIVQGAFARFRLRLRDRMILRLSHLLPARAASRYFAYRVRRGRESRLLAHHTPGLEILNEDWSAKTPVATLRARTHLIAGTDLADPMARIGVPLTLAQGRMDSVVPFAFFERLRAIRPDAKSVVWDDVGHLAVLTHPEKVAALF